MKKTPILFLMVPVFTFSCNKSTINIPKSPFNDSYNRIGLTSEYKSKIQALSSDESSKLKSSIDKYEGDKYVSGYTFTAEDRDLKYAYFGSETSSVSRCSMNSRNSVFNRYKVEHANKPYTIANETTSTQRQTSSGIIKTNSTTNTFIHNKNETEHKYDVTTQKKYNDEQWAISKKSETYEASKEESTFGLTPYDNILSQHFTESEKYKFKILGENAVYGKINYFGEKYIIKEAYSTFDEYKTKSGRKYKSSDNYFYEALLINKNDKLVFTNFRFYKEKLILSEAVDDTGIPVLYLDKPVLVEFNETKYEMKYDDLHEYEGDVPTAI